MIKVTCNYGIEYINPQHIITVTDIGGRIYISYLGQTVEVKESIENILGQIKELRK